MRISWYDSFKGGDCLNIGERIKKRRKEMDLSVEELAKRLGKNRATVYRYENGEIENLPTTILEPIAKALSTTPAYLMGYEDNLNIDTDFIADLMKDRELIEHVNRLSRLPKEQQKTIFDMIDFLSKEKGL